MRFEPKFKPPRPSKVNRKRAGQAHRATEIPVYGRQEQGAYNGPFESTCYHPLLLINGKGAAWR